MSLACPTSIDRAKNRLICEMEHGQWLIHACDRVCGLPVVADQPVLFCSTLYSDILPVDMYL